MGTLTEPIKADGLEDGVQRERIVCPIQVLFPNPEMFSRERDVSWRNIPRQQRHGVAAQDEADRAGFCSVLKGIGSPRCFPDRLALDSLLLDFGEGRVVDR